MSECRQEISIELGFHLHTTYTRVHSLYFEWRNQPRHSRLIAPMSFEIGSKLLVLAATKRTTWLTTIENIFTYPSRRTNFLHGEYSMASFF